MAALLDDREVHSFKSFAERRKSEYALRFPFLTERQITAKLRRVWRSRKGDQVAPSASRGRDRAIHLTHAGHQMPTATNCLRARMCPRGDLSAFDVDSDTSLTAIPQPPATSLDSYASSNTTTRTFCSNKQAAKNASATRPIRDFATLSAALSNDTSPSGCAFEDPSCHRSRRTAGVVGRVATTETSPVHQQSPPTSTAPKSPPRQPLQPLNPLSKPHVVSPAKSRGKPLSRSLATTLHEGASVPSPHEEPSSCELCTIHQNEAECFPTNTLPFSSSEARREAQFVSRGCLNTHRPIMAGVVVGSPSKWALLENRVLCHPVSPDMAPQLSPDSKKVCDTARFPPRRTPDITAVRRGAATRPSQRSSSPVEDPQFASLYTGDVIHSLPSPAPATPRSAAFLETCPAPALRPPTSSSDEISGCFQSAIANTVTTQSLVNESNVGQKHNPSSISHFTPATGVTTNTSNTSEIESVSCSLRGAEVPPQTDGVRRLVRRYRSRRRRESFLSSRLDTGTAGEKGVRDGMSSLPLSTSLRPTEVDHSEPLENDADFECRHKTSPSDKRRKVSFLCAGDVEVSSDTADNSEASVATTTTSPDPTRLAEYPHSEQMVPGGEPPREQLTPPGAGENLMCDMFRLLTPDRPSPEPHSRRHSRDVSSHYATSKRRVFRSASTEGSSNFYSMFIDESDIFM